MQALPISELRSRSEAEEILGKTIHPLAVVRFLLKNLNRDENDNFFWKLNLGVLSQNIDNLMKNFLTFVAFLSSTVICFGQTINEQRERERIAINKIKEITVWNHKYANGQPSPTGYKSSETTYNSQGLAVSVINYKSTGAISSKQSYSYDNNGNKTQYVNIDGKDGKITFQQTIVYDNQNNKLSEYGFDGSEPYRIIYKYNSQGKQSDITRYKANNSIDEKWVYTYLGSKTTITVYKTLNVVSYTMYSFIGYWVKLSILHNCRIFLFVDL